VALTDRTDEFSVLSGLLEGAQAGNSAALVLRGGPGIGKTALLEAVSGSADAHAMTTVHVAGIESEAPLGYAALHRLIRFFPGAVDRLPTPQRDALRTTFGLAFGPPPDRFLIGLSVLTLLADAAADGPLLAVIDDAQWLDPESGIALGFAARRLQAERVVMLFAARETEGGSPWLSALPELMIGPLDDRDATKLLSEVTSGLLGPAARARLLGECRGNPLALVEVARELTPEQLTGAAVLPDPLPAADSLRQLFARRLRQLTLGARLLLAVAAAEPTASGPLVRSVAQRLGAAAEADGELDRLVSFSDRVRFSRPLVRSAAYYSTPISERRRIHGALAEAMDSPQNSDRVTWHLAMSTTGPDEAIASRLEQVARRMRDRGGYAANSALLRRAAALSADEHSRTDRLLAAADAALTAGHPERARSMLAEARHRPVDERQAALALRLSGEALFATGATDDAARELLAAAKVLMPLDPSLARQTLLAALLAANFASAGAFEDVRSFAATIAPADPPPDDPPRVADLFLLGFLRRLAGDAELAARLLRNALTQLERSERADELRAATAYAARLDAGTGELTTSEIAAFITSQVLITVRQDDGLDIGAVVRRWDENPDFTKFGVGYLVYELLNYIVDSQLEAIQNLEDRMEKLEDRMFDGVPRVLQVGRRVSQLRKSLVLLRRIVVPMSEVVAGLMRHDLRFVGNDLVPYYQDVYDQVLRATERTDSLRDLVSTILETNLTIQGNRMNVITKKVTGWAAIIAVPTFITGFFGMNVPYPGFGDKAGLSASIAVIALAELVLYLIFKRKDWL
jgi:Mg2+ and Co2+ transporter CorA